MPLNRTREKPSKMLFLPCYGLEEETWFCTLSILISGTRLISIGRGENIDAPHLIYNKFMSRIYDPNVTTLVEENN